MTKSTILDFFCSQGAEQVFTGVINSGKTVGAPCLVSRALTEKPSHFASSCSWRQRQACVKHVQRHLVLLDVIAAEGARHRQRQINNAGPAEP